MSKRDVKEPTYEDLSKRYTDEEIVESFVLRSRLSEEEKKVSHKEFLRLRMERIKNMTPSEILLGNLMRMKIQIENYIEEDEYDTRFDFANQLKEYLSLIKKSQKDFADEIDMHPAQLNRIIRGKENPNIDLFYRIEKHSDGILEAIKLYRLQVLKLESEIKTDDDKRQMQYKRVKNKLSFAKAG